MSLDGIAIHALADELHQQLAGGRIDKIQQPDATTIVLSVRQPGRNDKLLLSCNPQTARIGLTTIAKPARCSRRCSAWCFASIWRGAGL